jgi:DNA-binding transcriptional regulator/RsmH inhibitor MraZ
MAHLLGTTRHRFDDKWRVVLPSSHREVIGGTLYFAPGDQGQVVLFPEPAFLERMALKSARQQHGDEGMRDYLTFTRRANRTQLDGQGRVVLPDPFRPVMTQDVVIVGAGDRLELWPSDRFADFFGEDA